MLTDAGTLSHVLPTHRFENRYMLIPGSQPCLSILDKTLLRTERQHGQLCKLLRKVAKSRTDRSFTSLDAISSKKEHGQLHKTKHLDNDDNPLDEEDLKYKPLGFGQGKTYDISLEDKLLEQIEHDKAAALSKEISNAASKKRVAKSNLEQSTAIGGIKVWVRDLPKKRNIDRDLRSAFRHVPGLLDISPSVIGNEKTRDPICKGFGFLTFDTLDHAESFISSFQSQPVSFGRVEKQLSFSLAKTSSAEVVSSGSKSSFAVSKLRVRDKDAGTVAGSCTRPELGFSTIVEQGTTVDVMQERTPTQLFQPKVEMVQDEIEIGSFEEDDECPGEEESDDDYGSDDESEIEVSVEIEDPSAIITNGPQGVADTKLMEAERHIEELEERLRKKLEIGLIESQKEIEKQMIKPRGFNSRKSLQKGNRRKSKPNGNNLAAVTHGLKKREREVMTGVLEKYGRGPSPTKP